MDEQGICPACEAVELEYSPVQTDDGGVHYPWECGSCEARGKEYYTIEFSHHEEAKEPKAQRHTLTGGLLGKTIFEHYDHEIYVTEYEFGQNYTLECDMCKEVLCWSENPRSKVYKALKELYQKQAEQVEKGKDIRVFFGRVGGRYGTLNYETDDLEQAVEVLRTRHLY